MDDKVTVEIPQAPTTLNSVAATVRGLEAGVSKIDKMIFWILTAAAIAWVSIFVALAGVVLDQMRANGQSMKDLMRSQQEADKDIQALQLKVEKLMPAKSN